MIVRRRCLRLTALAVALPLAACSHASGGRGEGAGDYPANYKADLLGAVHAYVADPTNIRDAYLSEPAVRSVGGRNRYTACVRFNAKNSDGRYTGSRDTMAVFLAGRFDQFIDPPPPGQTEPSPAAVAAKEACAQAEYRRFPELETLRR